MRTEKIKMIYPVIVEGKYDKIRLQSIIEGNIITTNGFSLMRDKRKLEYIRQICNKSEKVIVFTDSDGGGLVIRNYLRTVLPDEKVIHLYTPRIVGKERRKSSPSKEGILGVEGVETEKLRSIFLNLKAAESNSVETKDDICEVTKTEFYEDGFSGGPGSRNKRKDLADFLELPQNISANALLEAINLLRCKDRYRYFVDNYRCDDVDNEVM